MPHFPCLQGILWDCQEFSVNRVLGFEMIWTCIFKLVFWSAFDSMGSSCVYV